MEKIYHGYDIMKKYRRGDVIITRLLFTYNNNILNTCNRCGVKNNKKGDIVRYGYMINKMIDAPEYEIPNFLVIQRPRFLCRACNRTTTDIISFQYNNSKLTIYAAESLIEDIKKGINKMQVALRYGISLSCSYKYVNLLTNNIEKNNNIIKNI